MRFLAYKVVAVVLKIRWLCLLAYLTGCQLAGPADDRPIYHEYDLYDEEDLSIDEEEVDINQEW